MVAAGAKRRVLWIDACRNEPGKGAGDGRSFTQFKESDGTRILFSTKFGRMSYEDDELRQGVFSHFLVKGLRGEAGKTDGLISFRDIADYVKDGVQTSSLRAGHVQVPYEGGESSGDFLIGRAAAEAPTLPVPPPSPPSGPRPGDLKTNSTDGQRYAWIPPGKFTM